MNAQSLSLKALFQQYRQKEKECNSCHGEEEEKYDALYNQMDNIGGKILEATLQTMRDLAIQVLVMTDEGDAICYDDAKNCKLIKICQQLAEA